jgi:hypothetical protein
MNPGHTPELPDFARHGNFSIMTALDLANSAYSDSSPPSGASAPIRALWFAKAGQWETAHDLCQEIDGSAGSWIHAYLHRVEGDHPNAAYWYSRAGKPTPSRSLNLDDEWLQMSGELLSVHTS